MTICELCHGCGYDECVAYYYGRIECPRCEGCGYDPDTMTPEELQDMGLREEVEP